MASAPGWYLGGNLGQSRATIDNQRIVAGLMSSGFSTTSISDDNRALGFKLFGGYQFNTYLALEAGYFNLGEFGFTATTMPPGTLTGRIKGQGANLDLVASLQMSQRLSAFARGGVSHIEAKSNFSGTGSAHVLNPRRQQRGVDHKFGVGLEYDFVPAFGLRLEAERYRIGDAIGNKGDIDLFSAGLVYRFGAQSPAATLVAVTAKPVAPSVLAPPPSLEVIAPRKFSLSADSMFGFNRSEVNPAGRQELDQLASSLRGSSFELISVTGHTDRIGPAAYNYALSLRRAEAVKSYLLQNTNLPADKIYTRGVDGSAPVTKPDDCPGTRVTAALIACLQPDRRVEVVVNALTPR